MRPDTDASSPGEATPAGARSVILAGARTPVGRFLGGLSTVSATDLGAVAIRAALERAGVDPGRVDAVVMGQVLTAGTGQIPARQAAASAGVPMTVPSTTVNKVCLSGTAAIAQADWLIRLGEAEVVVAGGMESMSRAPHLLRDGRRGQAFGDWTLADHMERDGLWDSFTDLGMGSLAESGNVGAATVSRADQDAAAAASHQRAARAWKDGVFAAEVVPVPVPQRRGEPVLVERDEGIRPDTTLEALGRLRPVFAPEGSGGTITAGSASQISDGAAALVITGAATAEREGRTWLAEIVSYATVAGPDSTLQVQPANAIATACAKAGIAPSDLELVEINEAFAAVSVAAARLLGLDLERVNVDGGAIALGHPIGASGARITLHLAHALAARAEQRGEALYGAAALCGGGGQGDAIVLRATPRRGSQR
ncbi:MAG: acetyl-CoA C-acyltransferase [Kineosporiaceae bacterium]|nr:acetyl-CoA C-acyltransferase [Kineosporiaceae bacterium]